MTACLSSTSIAFYDILAQACAEIKILTLESDLRFFQVRLLYFFFRFSFSPFLFFSFRCSVGLLIGLLAESVTHRDEQILPWISHV